MSVRIGILISGRHGRGSNMAAITDACQDGRINGHVTVVIGNYAESPALERARSLGIETVVVPSPPGSAGPEAEDRYGSALATALADRNVELICLAGYIRRVPATLTRRFQSKIMNIHNALIPAFCGKGMYGIHVHTAAVEYGVKVSGCTVHFVDEGYDTGPIILQSVVPVEMEDTPEDLAARVLVAEHDTFWRAIALYAERRLVCEGRRVRILPEQSIG